jgi:hypothetical protein
MRKLVSYTINSEVIAKFNKITSEKAINKSKLLELLIKEWISKNHNEEANT